MNNPTDIAFTNAVKAVQTRKGSRDNYASMQMGNKVEPFLAEFISQQRSFYLATASAEGQPYIQHRGGPPGFLKVLDERRLGFADFRGNRQFITTGNATENDKAYIFLMNYAARQRVKIWGTLELSEDSNLISSLFPDGYRARAEQAMIFKIEAWDGNCPQHIPQMFHADDVQTAIEELDKKINKLEQEIRRLRSL